MGIKTVGDLHVEDNMVKRGEVDIILIMAEPIRWQRDALLKSGKRQGSVWISGCKLMTHAEQHLCSAEINLTIIGQFSVNVKTDSNRIN